MADRLLFCCIAILSTWVIVSSTVWAAKEVKVSNKTTDGCMETRNPLAMPFAPEDGAVVSQTPPDFTWPLQQKSSRYQFRLYSSADVKEKLVSDNWLNWPEVLLLGTYSWQVRAIHNDRKCPWSALRYFRVPAKTQDFVIPSAQTLLRYIKQTARPRTFPHSDTLNRLKSLILNDRTDGWEKLQRKVARSSKQKLSAEPTTSADGLIIMRDRRFSARKIRQIADSEAQHMVNAAFVYMIAANDESLKEAKRRALNLASWDADGSTGLSSHDMVNRKIAFSLAVVYDWLLDKFDPKEVSLIGKSINLRMANMHKRYIENKRLASRPFDSHGWVTLGRMAVIAAIMAGETINADTWVKNAIPLYFNSIAPWGGRDGGFSNGSTYGGWDYATSLPVWDMLFWSTGVNVYKKPWVQNYLPFLVYSLPPGTPAGIFGDGAEKKLQKVWARLAAGYALRMPSTLSNWYAAHQIEANSGRFDLLTALPIPDISDTFQSCPPDIPNAIYFPSIGWTAMHSDLTDPSRVSVFFKSSPYGSFNHSHADQNSFVLNANGKTLAIDSGYYDWYGSPHWRQWYKQTQAHNGITFDGGKGQAINDKGASGKIVHFEKHDKYDVVVGDATKAYKGELSKARRTMVYIRPETLIIYDRLDSANAHYWEWNIHALYKMEQTGKQTVKINNLDTTLCIQIVEPKDVSFTQTNQFTAPADFNNKDVPNQWHGRFFRQDQTKSSTFIAVLQVNCQTNKLVDDIKFQNDQYVLTIQDTTVIIGEDGAEVSSLITH